MSTRALRRHARVILDTRRATEEDWERVRGLVSLGGGDAAAAVGESEWDSPYTIWLRKLGLLPPRLRTERMTWGLRLEAVILRAFAEETGLRVRPQHTLLQSKEHPFMVARMDALAEGDGLPLAVVDAKATRGWSGEGPSPDAYWQLQHYMIVTGLPLGWLAVLESGAALRVMRVPADPEAQAALLELETRLWQHITEGTPPPLDGSDATREALLALEPAADEGVRELDAEALGLVRRRQELTTWIGELEEQRQEAENRLRAWLGSAGRATLMGQTALTYREHEVHRLDIPALRERHPKLAARFTRVSSARPLHFRRSV